MRMSTSAMPILQAGAITGNSKVRLECIVEQSVQLRCASNQHFRALFLMRGPAHESDKSYARAKLELLYPIATMAEPSCCVGYSNSFEGIGDGLIKCFFGSRFCIAR